MAWMTPRALPSAEHGHDGTTRVNVGTEAQWRTNPACRLVVWVRQPVA
jgi:hypothetical protein